jgi:hypothetical protein
MQLDKTKPHGTVFGDNQGRVYEQDGKYFRGNGSLWVPTETELAIAAAENQEEPNDDQLEEATTNKVRKETAAKGASKAKAQAKAKAAKAPAKPIQAAPLSAADQQVADQLTQV